MDHKRLICAEISHLSAPINVREKVALDKDKSQNALREINKNHPEAFILSTCNRTAIYAIGSSSNEIKSFYSRFGLLDPYINIYDDTQLAVKNLMRTAAGIESQAIGEHQIIGQIRSAYEWSTEINAMGPCLDYLVRRAVHAGKRVRHETKIGQHSASIASVGYELLKTHFKNLDNLSILVLGTGSVANLIGTLLERHGLNKLAFVSQSKDRADSFSANFGGYGVLLEDAIDNIGDFDIIIGGSDAGLKGLTSVSLLDKKASKRQFFLDLALPRNFDPSLAELEHITLVDLDQLKEKTYTNIKKRSLEIPQAERIVDEEVENYISWFKKRSISPLISNYWNRLEGLKDAELEWLWPKLGELEVDHKKLIQRFAHRLIRKIAQPSFKNMEWMAEAKHLKLSPVDTFKKFLDMPDADVFVPKEKIYVGTRGSKLALTQTQMVLDAIREYAPDYEFEVKVIKTAGDSGNLDQIGAFTTAIQEALQSEEIDMAVHSMKDLPTARPEGLVIAAIPEREDVRDVLISRERLSFWDLKEGAVIGTGSPRRALQLKALRPDVNVSFIRGNVDTRIQKMENGDYDAIVLAASGLKRIGMIHKASQIFSTQEILPAVNQGALGIEIKENNNLMRNLLKGLNSSTAYLCCQAERAFLNAVGGGCQVPYGAHAFFEGERLILRAIYAEDELGDIVRRKESLNINNIEKEATDLAKEMIKDFKNLRGKA
mgnify:CR=1 FL=1